MGGRRWIRSEGGAGPAAPLCRSGRPPRPADRGGRRRRAQPSLDDEHTLILSAAGVHVLLIRLRHHGWIDEVIDSAGTVATWAVNAWTLIGHDLSLELTRPATATLGVPRLLSLRLDVNDDGIRLVRAALLEILRCACFVVDPPEGCLAG